MSYQPEINASVLTAVYLDIQFPTFEMEVDGDIDGEYIGVFGGPGHDITFYGPTPDHVIGAAHRYAGKLTEGSPYTLEVTIEDEEVEAELVPLP